MTRSKLNQKLEDVRKVLKSSETATIGLGGQPPSCEVEASRIMSSDSAHYILVKGMEMEGSDEEDLEPAAGLDVESRLHGDKQLADHKDGDVIIGGDDVIAKSSNDTLNSEHGIGLEWLDSSRPAQQTGVIGEDTTTTTTCTVTDGEREVEQLPQDISKSQTGPAPLGQDISQSQCSHVLHDVDTVHTEDTFASDTNTVTGECTPRATDPLQSMTSEPTNTVLPAAHDADRIDVSPSPLPSSIDDLDTTEPVLDTTEPLASESDSAGHQSPSSPERSPRPISPQLSGRGKEVGVSWTEELLQLSPEAAQLQLREEGSELEQQRERQRRAAATISSHVYREAQVRDHS